MIGRSTAVSLTSCRLNSSKTKLQLDAEEDLGLQSDLFQENYYEQYTTGSNPSEITVHSGYLEFPLWIFRTNLNFNFRFQDVTCTT